MIVNFKTFLLIEFLISISKK